MENPPLKEFYETSLEKILNITLTQFLERRKKDISELERQNKIFFKVKIEKYTTIVKNSDYFDMAKELKDMFELGKNVYLKGNKTKSLEVQQKLIEKLDDKLRKILKEYHYTKFKDGNYDMWCSGESEEKSDDPDMWNTGGSWK